MTRREDVIAIATSFPDHYAEALGGDPLSPAQVDALLELARVVAHGTERKFAPLSTYLAGRYVAERVAAGTPEDEALAEAAAVAERSARDCAPPAG